MSNLSDIANGIVELVIFLLGFVLIIAAVGFYLSHTDIENDMEAICDGIKESSYDSCDDAQFASGVSRTLALGCGLFGLVALYYAQRIYNDPFYRPLDFFSKRAGNTPPPISASPTTQEDKYERIERLDNMREKGILSDEEFQREKDKILK
tara:strand:+ start:318 stop:770 length:453 start_codon:yes stop_codon:yes gene_type:complete